MISIGVLNIGGIKGATIPLAEKFLPAIEIGLVSGMTSFRKNSDHGCP